MINNQQESDNNQTSSIALNAGSATAIAVVLAVAAKISGFVGIPAALLAIMAAVAAYKEWAAAKKEGKPTTTAQVKFYTSIAGLGLALGEILLATGIISTSIPFLMPALLIAAGSVIAIVGIITLVQKWRSKHPATPTVTVTQATSATTSTKGTDYKNIATNFPNNINSNNGSASSQEQAEQQKNKITYLFSDENDITSSEDFPQDNTRD